MLDYAAYIPATGMLSPSSNRYTAKATLAIVLLGLVITTHQLLHLDQSFYSGTNLDKNSTKGPSSSNFFRLWDPPWSRTAESRQATTFDPQGPECPRTLLYRFAGAHGFASEYLIFLRVVLLAKHFNYKVIIDDSQWNYGTWTNYFTPVHLPCHMPYGFKSADRVPLAPLSEDPPLAFVNVRGMQPSWTEAAHVIWSTRKLDYLDQLILDLYTNATDVDNLHLQDRTTDATHPPLNKIETLPLAYRSIFDIMSMEVSYLWSLNSELRNLVDSILSPTALGAPLIAAHVRLGDKSMEIHKFGPGALPKPRKTLQQLYDIWRNRIAVKSSEMAAPPFHGERGTVPGASSARRGNFVRSHDSSSEVSITATQDAYVEAAGTLSTELESRRLGLGGKPAKPTLLVISDDASRVGLGGILRSKTITAFRLVLGLDALATDVEEQSAAQLKTPLIESGSTSEEAGRQGFFEGTFNALPLAERVASTKLFLRDITATARLADALVFTSSSNVGRLLALLNAQGGNPDKMFSSVDVRWFPTARYQ